jgi:hypothetical protein
MSEKLNKNVVLGQCGPISLALTTGRLILAKKKDLDIASPDNGIMGQMFVDPVILAQNVWTIYGDRISKAGVQSEEEFYELLDETGNRELDTAFKNAVSDFFTWGRMFVDQVNKAYGQATENLETEIQSQSLPSPETPGSESGSTQES